MWTRVKSYTFWRKNPKSQKKLSKIMTFLKNLIFITWIFPHFWRSIHAPALRPFIAIGWKSPRSLILWQFIRKYQPGMSFVRRTPDIRNFSMLKKQKFSNCDFWPRKCSKWPNLVPGSIKKTFWPKQKFWNFSIFGLRKISKFFHFVLKFSKFWLNFF